MVVLCVTVALCFFILSISLVFSLVFFINVYFCKYVSYSGNIQSMNNQLGQDENGTNYVFNI